MYEHRRLPVLTTAQYLQRLVGHFGLALLVVSGSLAAGMAGYAYFEGLGWDDAFVNAAMLLGGEGPLESPQSHGGKLFAGLYALYSGVVFIVVAGIMLAPVAHRVLHRFHLEEPDR